MTRGRDEIVKTIVRETLAERFTDDEFAFGSFHSSIYSSICRRNGTVLIALPMQQQPPP